jgi:membrane-bound lytic murein transglycosylase D
MKSFSNFLSLACLVILLGYIIYAETKRPRVTDSISDDGVVMPNTEEMEDYGTPLSAIAFDLPKKAFFSNEPVPLNIPDVRERLDKELQINSYTHSNTIFLIKRANRWLPPNGRYPSPTQYS